MIPFLYSNLVALFHSILELLVKPDVLNEYHSGKNIMKNNLDKDLTFKKIKIFISDILQRPTQRSEHERCNG